MKFQHTLDPTPRKFNCPSCGKKRFVRYINTQTGEYLPIHYGRCDREVNCSYHQKPERGRVLPSGSACLPSGRWYARTGGGSQEPPTDISSKFDTIEFPLFRFTLPNQTKNNLIQYLKTLFPRETVKKLIINFFIGASNHWPGATIFWQIDKNENIRSGQVMLYDKETGKRVKVPFPHITWVHTILLKKGKLKSFNLKQCLFGEHQLIDSPRSRSIAIVESAKTAIIMTGIFPGYIWMATNGSHNMNPEFFQPIKDRYIILYPDLGQYDFWNQKATHLQKQGFKVTVSDLLETFATPEDQESGLDIADYFINHQSLPASAGGKTYKLALSKDEALFYSFTNKYRTILNLVDALDLVNPNNNKPFNNITTL